MSDNRLMHATAVVVNNCGVLLTGKSGSGKSDLALRLIESKNAALIADDAVLLEKKEQKLYARAAENIAGLLEVRGVGLVKYPYIKEAPVDLCVNLTDDTSAIERLPEKRTKHILGLEIKQIDLYAKENSAPEKVMAAIRYWNNNRENIEE